MKNLMKNNLLLILALATMGILVSCSKHDANDDSSGTGINTNPPSGAWRISMYFDTGDETNNFSGYSFTFNTGGTISATNGSNTVTGTWSQSSTKFIISFGTTPVFDDLNDDWLIVEKTNSSIKLKDDNPAQDDRLEFTRL